MADPRDDGTFSPGFAGELDRLFAWRRDVRRFRREAPDRGVIEELFAAAELAPSVGNSQPWRWVEVRSPEIRAEVRENFHDANAAALSGYSGEKARHYAGLKLAGLDAAPLQLAVFCCRDPEQGHGLGRATMPETLEYSAAMAIGTLWLAARARGIGVGWISIVDPQRLRASLDVPQEWTLVGYLCVGYPEHADDVPELEREGWQGRTDPAERRFVR